MTSTPVLKQLRAIITSVCVCIVAAIAVCNREPAKPPNDVRPLVLVAPYSPIAGIQFDEGLDVVGNYVKRSGDSMFGTLRMNGTTTSGSILWNGSVPCGQNGAVCLYYSGTSLVAYVGGANRFTISNSDGTITMVGGTTVTGQVDVVGSVTSTLLFQSSRNAGAGFSTSGTGWFENAGDTAANIATRVPTAGSGALIYDDTNNVWQVYQNGGWLFLTGVSATNNALTINGNLRASTFQLTNIFAWNTANKPTISSGFGTSPSVTNDNGTIVFTINVGTGGVATTGVIGMPAASNGWECECTDITTKSATVFYTKQTGTGTTTTCPIGNFTTAGIAGAWAASDILVCRALAY